LKVTTRDLSDLKLNRLSASGVIERLIHFSTQRAERLSLRLDVGKIGSRLVRAKSYELHGFAIRQRAQQHGVDDAEDCGVQSNSQRQRCDRNHCERRSLQQTTYAIANVFD
jgi:hypothetical protein